MNHHDKNIELENLKNKIISADWETAKTAADKLIKTGSNDVLAFFINLLDSANPDHRNIAALALKDMRNDQAVNPLFEAIFKPENHNNNGTMVYALESLECKNHFVDLFKILFYESYEAKVSAYKILSEQIFEFNQEDLIQIQELWNDCNQNAEKYPGFLNEKTRSMMQNAYEGYIEYLKEF